LPLLLNKKVWLRFILQILVSATAAIASADAQNSATDAQMAAAVKQREQTMDAMNASIQKQKVSVRRQRQSALPAGTIPVESDFFITEALIQPQPMTADCEQLSQLQVESLATRASKANGISPDLVRAVMKQESAFRPCAVSPVGALGLMQLMPATAAELGVNDAMDPEENTFAGAKLLRKLMDRYSGDLNRTLGAYNAGPTRVDEADGIPKFPETINYVDKIMRDLGVPSLTMPAF
jgi:soluble lytic murein transglycosylase-like protein